MERFGTLGSFLSTRSSDEGFGTMKVMYLADVENWRE